MSKPIVTPELASRPEFIFPDADSPAGIANPSLVPSSESTADEVAAAVEATDSSPQSIIEVIDASIASAGDVSAYTVNNRTVQQRSLGELIGARKYFQAQAARQNGLRRTVARFRS